MNRTDPGLSRLWAEFELARARHREQLRGRDESALATSTRYDALEALEAYVTALETRHLPVPPAVHRDLTLLRNLCVHTRTRRSALGSPPTHVG